MKAIVFQEMINPQTNKKEEVGISFNCVLHDKPLENHTLEEALSCTNEIQWAGKAHTYLSDK